MRKNFLYSLIARFRGLEFKPQTADGFYLKGQKLNRIDLFFGLNNNLIIESTSLDLNKDLIQVKYQNGEVWQYRNIASFYKTPIVIKTGKGVMKITIGKERITFNNDKILFTVK